jgi:hypothetical protein
MWDEQDRQADNRRLERGEGVLDLGHETPVSTVQDANLDEIVALPPHSIWPFVSGLAVAGIFAMLLLHHYFIALGFLVVGAVVLFAWHHRDAEA